MKQLILFTLIKWGGGKNATSFSQIKSKKYNYQRKSYVFHVYIAISMIFLGERLFYYGK